MKPITEWEMLDMSSKERRDLFCSVISNMVAIACVIWSLYLLIDINTEEIQSKLQWPGHWPFWTNLVLVTTSTLFFIGGLVFMYVQCKVYIQFYKKWKAYNRTIVVQVRLLVKS